MLDQLRLREISEQQACNHSIKVSAPAPSLCHYATSLDKLLSRDSGLVRAVTFTTELGSPCWVAST